MDSTASGLVLFLPHKPKLRINFQKVQQKIWEMLALKTTFRSEIVVCIHIWTNMDTGCLFWLFLKHLMFEAYGLH